MSEVSGRIPQCNPLASYLDCKAEIDSAISGVLQAGRYILGPEVASFEQSFARWNDRNHAIGVGNGTDALEIALRTLEIGPGDAVVTTSMSAVATAVAIRRAGAVPVFADIDPVHGLIAPASIEHACERTELRVRAIVPVHLYGRCADMDSICEIAQRRNLSIIEDCAQAHGASWNGRLAGTFGVMAAFSFYPTKNLGAIGDGGAILTNDEQLGERARLLREYGWKRRYVSELDGGNSRLDELQAAILRVKLSRLTSDNANRRRIAAIYRELITNPKVEVYRGCDAGHVYHQFVVHAEDRRGLQTRLANEGIGSLIHYPAAIHEQPVFAQAQSAPVSLANTERWSRTVLSLPMFPQMMDEQAVRVAEVINGW